MSRKMRNDYCGLLNYRPIWIQQLGTVQFFTFFACIIVAIQGIYLGYFIGIITTVEKRFGLPSTSSGALLSAYDVGHALSVLIVGHYGFWLHKAKWVAIGGYMSALGCFGLALPHIIFGAFDNNNLLTKNESNYKLCVLENDSTFNNSALQTNDDDPNSGENNAAYYILIIFQIVCGLSSSPFTTLTYIYIDDNATKKKSPLYLGLMSAMWAFGPALGFGLSALCTQTFVTLGVPPLGINSQSKNWIGAWWLGLIVLSILYMVFSTPFLFFPRTLKRVRAFSLSRHSGDSKKSVELLALKDLTTANTYVIEKKNVKWCLNYFAKIPLEVYYLIKNPIVVTLCLSWIFWAYIVGGYSTFLPKYLESQFYQPTHLANIYGGLVAILGVATATGIGGKILSHFNPRPHKALLLVLFTGLACAANFLLLILIQCPNVPINGLPMDQLQLSLQSINATNASCTNLCTCSPKAFEPVCSDESVFYSPCYAGCIVANQSNELNPYSSCLCTPSGFASTGYCQDPCGLKMVLYLIAAFLSGFVGALFQMAQFTTVIWAVPVAKKTIALALSNFFTSVLGFMPSQVIYGKIIDTTCFDKEEKSNCLIYDHNEFRVRYHLVTAMFQFCSMIFVGLACYFSRNYEFHMETENDEENEKS